MSIDAYALADKLCDSIITHPEKWETELMSAHMLFKKKTEKNTCCKDTRGCNIVIRTMGLKVREFNAPAWYPSEKLPELEKALNYYFEVRRREEELRSSEWIENLKANALAALSE